MPAPYADGDALVFPEGGTPATCVGLVHGTISDNTGGKLAAVVPAHFIVETIRLADRDPGPGQSSEPAGG